MKNKILPILCIFILVGCLFINNNVFATEYTITEDRLNSILDYVQNNYYYLNGNSNFCITPSFNDGSDYSYDLTFFPDDNSIKYYISSENRIFSTSSFDSHLHDVKTDGSISFRVTWNNFARIRYSQPFYSTFDIYTDSSCSEIFFQKTPVTETPETTPDKVEIPAVETVEQIPVAMMETLKMIIPVGLVVLSVVLVIYLTRRLISHFS